MELSKKDLFNAKNSSKQLEDGLMLKVLAVATMPDVDKDGKDIEVGVIKTEDGIYSTISATVINSLDMLSDIIADDGEVDVAVRVGTSKSGRDFFMLEII